MVFLDISGEMANGKKPTDQSNLGLCVPGEFSWICAFFRWYLELLLHQDKNGTNCLLSRF